MQSQFSLMQFVSRCFLRGGVFLCFILLCCSRTNAQSSPPILQVDMETGSTSCPPSVTQSTNMIVRLTNVNDLLFDFEKSKQLVYQLKVRGTFVGANAPDSPITLMGKQQTCSENGIKDALDKIIEKFKKEPNSYITPQDGGKLTIGLHKTIAEAEPIKEVTEAEKIFRDGDSACRSLFTGFPVGKWIARLAAQTNDGSAPPPHSVDFQINVEPNMHYNFAVFAIWKDRTEKLLAWDCGQKDVISMSAGTLITMLPYRSYNHQKAPVPAGSATIKDTLSVGGTSNVNILGAALLNLHLPDEWFERLKLPAETGVAISVGPVYKLGDAAKASSLGIFAGLSIHLYRSLFLTPGGHIGEFSDFPAGFYPGMVIPDQFGDLNPVKRNTVHFAIGLTYKTSSFKKTNSSPGSAKPNSGAPTTAKKKPNP